jgi:hypothetical protein
VTLSARLPLVLGAALAATLAAAGAFFLLAQGGSSAEQPTDQAAQTGSPTLPPEAKQERVPQALTSALDRHEVVVVAWFAPVDAAAMAGAREGARAAGAGFVQVNVMKEPSALAFADDHGGLESPAVFVFTRGRNGPTLRTRLPGTPDRDVVAQAAANAS